MNVAACGYAKALVPRGRVVDVARDEIETTSTLLQKWIGMLLGGAVAYRAHDNVVKELAAQTAKVDIEWHVVNALPALTSSPNPGGSVPYLTRQVGLVVRFEFIGTAGYLKGRHLE